MEEKDTETTATEVDTLLDNTHILNFSEAALELLKVGSPFFASAVVIVVGNMTTASMVAKLLGTEALAASGLASSLQNLLTGTLSATLNGVSIVSGNIIGKGELANVGNVLHQGWIGAFLLSIPPIGLMLANKPIFLLLGQDPEIVELTNKFFQYYCFSLPAMTMLTCNRRLALATKNAWISFVFDVIYQTIYTTLCYILMTQSTLGFSALGLSNLLSAWATFGLSSIFMFRSERFKNYGLTSFSSERLFYGLGDLIKIGTSFGIKVGIELGVILLTNITIGHLSVGKEAANAAASQFMSFVLIPILSIMDTIATLISHAVGSGNTANAKKLGYAGIMLGLLVAIPGLLASEILPSYLATYFIGPDALKIQEIIDAAISLIRINGVGMLADTISNLSAGALSGYYDITIPTIIISTAQLLVIPTSYVFGIILKMNEIGIIGPRAIASAVCALLLFPRFVLKTESALLEEPVEDQSNSGCWKKVTTCLPWRSKLGFDYGDITPINAHPDDVNDIDVEKKSHRCQCVLF